MRRFIYNLITREDGPTAVEYAVLLALIVIACIGSVGTLATATGDSFDESASQLTTAMGS